MKEVDPEVARLLEDLPKSKLPPALDKEGWGRFSIEQMQSVGKVPKTPSTEQQPVYDARCYQCARPITMSRAHWTDHSGGTDCDGGAVVEREFPHHVVESEIEFVRDMDRRSKERAAERTVEREKQRAAAAARDAKKEAAAAQPCQASRGGKGCTHKCMEKRSDHFGFHHCRYCGHLWA